MSNFAIRYHPWRREPLKRATTINIQLLTELRNTKHSEGPAKSVEPNTEPSPN